MDFINLQNHEQAELIKDLILHPLKVNKDESGILVETLRSDWSNIYGEGREFAMQYYSKTPGGVARDENVWHLHPTQEDRFLVISGEIITAVADGRSGSETGGLINLFHMKAEENPYIVLIPSLTYHGFMVVSKEPAILLNFPTLIYNQDEEKRVPHEEASIKMPDGTPFSWELVRKEFAVPGS